MADHDRSDGRDTAAPAAAGGRRRGGARRGARCRPTRRAGAGRVRLEDASRARRSRSSSSRARAATCSRKYHKEFEDLTGITVGSEMIPEQQQRQKAVIEFNSGNPSFDVIAISYHVQKRLFGKNKWLEDVRPLIADKSLTDPDLDFADFAKGGIDWATQPDGRIDSLPFNIDPWVRLLQQGAVRRQGHRVSEELRRDGRRGREAQRSRPRASAGFVGARPQERQRAGVVELPAGLRRRLRRRQGQAA